MRYYIPSCLSCTKRSCDGHDGPWLFKRRLILFEPMWLKNCYLSSFLCDFVLLYRWGNDHYLQIARVIISIFSTECLDTYYFPPKAKKDSPKGISEKATGKVPDKMRNKRNQWNEWVGVTRKRKRDEEDDIDADNPRIEGIMKNRRVLVFRWLIKNFVLSCRWARGDSEECRMAERSWWTAQRPYLQLDCLSSLPG